MVGQDGGHGADRYRSSRSGSVGRPDVMKRVIKAALVLVVVNGVVQLVGRYLSRRYAKGGEDTNEFRIAAIASGARFRSRAGALREGSCRVSCGGAKIDLREAQLDSRGAELTLETTMGGIEVRVPPGWRVEMDTSGVMFGGVDLRVPPEDAPSDSAPTLRVLATARLGGITVET